MNKKPTVRFLELAKNEDVTKLEKKINLAIKKAQLGSGAIKLFLHSDGTYGFQMTASPGKKKDLDAIYDLVMKNLPVTKRGRKRSTVSKVQAKYMLPDELHKRIKKLADEREITASEFVEECLKQAVG